ncbi:D-alanine--D-alanine ligase family protein [Oceanispirochaeta sp.]|jgi:D-alanine-D-alanine ligase|uniref:D-alanine--D-alanine ligase family protein n=1 Tax=Oceanispirochaeta sp. TaxID=2035350 RepID=UPI002620BA58|nr:D-alanine--D-alanine ligase family protein [Oceanispirochaeta sp.]MDA3958530.1 D-alanine--D-alanine ligase [Oceanispirochaeta sp.]
MNKTSVALLYGGRSGEHEVSLRSAASVYKHIDREKYYIHLIGINRQGVWFLQNTPGPVEDVLSIEEDVQMMISVIPGKGLSSSRGPISVDVVLPILHGTFGEDGTLQGLLEIADLPYAGADAGSSYLSMDKDIAKIIWQHHNLPVVPFRSIRKSQTEAKDFDWKDLLEDLKMEFSLPLFIKPSQCGSSVGVSRVEKEDLFQEAMEKAFRYDLKVLVEPAVNAREVECSVVGNESPKAFPPGELVPSHEFYDYDAKYIDPDGAALVIPAVLSQKEAQNVMDIAVRAYSALGCSGMARVDFFMDRLRGELYLNEINTIPGFTSISMFPLMCESGGLDYADLLDELINLALSKYESRHSLRFSLM